MLAKFVWLWLYDSHVGLFVPRVLTVVVEHNVLYIKESILVSHLCFFEQSIVDFGDELVLGYIYRETDIHLLTVFDIMLLGVLLVIMLWSLVFQINFMQCYIFFLNNSCLAYAWNSYTNLYVKLFAIFWLYLRQSNFGNSFTWDI